MDRMWSLVIEIDLDRHAHLARLARLARLAGHLRELPAIYVLRCPVVVLYCVKDLIESCHLPQWSEDVSRVAPSRYV